MGEPHPGPAVDRRCIINGHASPALRPGYWMSLTRGTIVYLDLFYPLTATTDMLNDLSIRLRPPRQR